jgi:hypothetical protein
LSFFGKNLEMRLIFGICVFFGVAFMQAMPSATSDTVLVEIRSNPFFYNVINTPEGEVYAGTSKGVYRWENTKSILVSEDKGYVIWDRKNNKLVTKSTLLENYSGRDYYHLLRNLPITSAWGAVFNAHTSENLYLVTNGIFYIFDINPYSIIHRFQSIRSISNNYVGTYTGVYRKGERFGFDSIHYTNGYIREYGDTAFICYDGLILITPNDIIRYRYPLNEEVLIGGEKLGHARDIYPIEKGGWFLSTTKGLYVVDQGLTKASQVVEHKSTHAPVIVGLMNEVLLFSVDSTLYRYHEKTGTYNAELSLPEPIFDGVIKGYKVCLLTKNGLYLYRAEYEVEKLTTLEDAHTILPIDQKRCVIGTNRGLFMYNDEVHALDVLVDGVEFNRKALHLKNKTLYAGSISGLFVFDITTLEGIIERNKVQTLDVEKTTERTYWILVIIVLCIALLISIYRSRHFRKKYRKVVSDKKKEVTLGDIESFIISDLPNMSINLISEHFGINNKQLYKILEPEKPGAVINRIRMLTLRKGWQRGAGIYEISKETGFSVSYIKKLQQNRNTNG